MTAWRVIIGSGLVLTLVACASHPVHTSRGRAHRSSGTSAGGGYYQNDGPPGDQDIDLSAIPDAVPTREPRSKYGNPDSYEALGKTYYVLRSAAGFTQTGRASWYGRQFHGERTSSGEPYNMYRMTAAHKRLPIPSYVRVTNLDNDKHVIVRVNDRGPFHDGRIIDLSYVAARKLGIVATGSAPVRIKTVTPGTFQRNTDTDYSSSPSSRSTATVSNTPLKSEPAHAPGVTDQHSRSPSRNLYLQSGAFGEIAHARSLSARLRAAGFKQVMIVDPDRGTPFYRVRVGPFANQRSRATVRQSLAARGFAARTVDR